MSSSGEERQFPLPVDSEHKALQIKIFSFAQPHMRAFHLCWFGFFTSFVSTFAPAAMIPVVRESLSLDANSIGNAGAAPLSAASDLRVLNTALKPGRHRTACTVHHYVSIVLL